jgi:hypothetical protein
MVFLFTAMIAYPEAIVASKSVLLAVEFFHRVRFYRHTSHFLRLSPDVHFDLEHNGYHIYRYAFIPVQLRDNVIQLGTLPNLFRFEIVYSSVCQNDVLNILYTSVSKV